MSGYKYIDVDCKYTDKETGVLINLLGIKNDELLTNAESAAVTKRLNELRKKPIKIKGVETLFKIHKHLFQDIYEWAGKNRTVEISKSGKQFFPLALFANAFSYIDNLILEYRKIPKNDKTSIANKLAEILDSVNFLHPFREGNGRTQREFIRFLALEKGLDLDLNPPDNKDVYDKYMQGTIDGNLKMLSELIFELFSK